MSPSQIKFLEGKIKALESMIAGLKDSLVGHMEREEKSVEELHKKFDKIIEKVDGKASNRVFLSFVSISFLVVSAFAGVFLAHQSDNLNAQSALRVEQLTMQSKLRHDIDVMPQRITSEILKQFSTEQ